ncbi:MAG: protein-L-isoaspartate(D-aspartate) O-methyltransferase [Mariprofundaceae bacterium]|nr:protein-L-isoaspartate(D-aspartate) O-methyltransferase [Mariprofundaceae bacterium]
MRKSLPTLSFELPRRRMIENQLIPAGIQNQHVLDAMYHIHRHLFVDQALIARAYQDSALPIGAKQTISQPFMVARMTELLNLQGHERVLEIGTGCGYQTAVLSCLCQHVYSIERIEVLHQKAQQNLLKSNIHNVTLKCADGRLGWAEHAPFDAIIVTAGGFASDIWMQQLSKGGVLLMPEGEEGKHCLVRREKKSMGIEETYFNHCSFVPLLEGEQYG